MTRKDSEKDSERPHYYSQFWLDVAAGRRIIGTPKQEEGESIEPEALEPEPALQRKTGIASEPDTIRATADGRATEPIHVNAESEPVEEYASPETEEEEFDDTAYQDESLVADADIPDMDLGVEEEEPEEEEEFLEEEELEEEEEEDLNWGRGRKKSKPTRPVKPAVKKPGKRDSRRGY